MTKKRLIRCTRCNALALFSPLDRTPEYHRKQDTWDVVERDDSAPFMEAHGKHQLEELHVIEGSFIRRENYSEPVGISYFEATNGKQRFVIKKCRESVCDPQRYELLAGKLHIKPTQLRIDDLAVRRELESAFSPSQLPPEKIGRFVKNWQNTVSQLSPSALRRVPFENDNPSEWCYYANERVLEEVLEESSEFLTPREVEKLREFIRMNLEEDLFMVRARVEFHIEGIENNRRSEKTD